MVELLINPEDRRTKEAKCDEVGITPKTLCEWQKNPEFIKYKNTQLDLYTNAQLDEVWKAHLRVIKMGNVEAIKLYHQLKGNFVEKSKVQSEITGDLKVENVPNYDFYKELTPGEIKAINEAGVYPTSLESARKILEALKK